ncbi:MAG: metallophosphoesterase family protein [Phycisphaerales bacterium]
MTCIGPGPRPVWSFRNPHPPRPIEPFDLFHPAVPPELEGLRILHLSDLHIERLRPRPAYLERTLAALRVTPADLVVLTGDYMTHPGDEPAALAALIRCASAWNSRFGACAIAGNHDTPGFLKSARIPGLKWLSHESVEIPIDRGRGKTTLRLIGSGFPESLLAASSPPSDNFSLALVHDPAQVYAAARLSIPIVLAGHTHGGQFRPHKSFAPHTSCDLPGAFASGIFRLDSTILCISRGLGSAFLPFRFNCPPQAPLYTLRRAEHAAQACPTLSCVRRW